MRTKPSARRSDLFLLRVWREQVANGTVVFCGRLQSAKSGERSQFRGLPALLDLLTELLEQQNGAPEEPDESSIAQDS